MGDFQPTTLQELAVFINLKFVHIEKQLDKLDDLVSKDQHNADVQELKAELRETKVDLANYKQAQAALVKWVIGAFILPGMAVLISVIALLTDIFK